MQRECSPVVHLLPQRDAHPAEHHLSDDHLRKYALHDNAKTRVPQCVLARINVASLPPRAYTAPTRPAELGDHIVQIPHVAQVPS